MFTGNKHLCWSLCLVKLQASRPATLLNTDSNKVFSCVILRSFYEQPFQKTKANGCLCYFSRHLEHLRFPSSKIYVQIFICVTCAESYVKPTPRFFTIWYTIYIVIVSSGQLFWLVYFTSSFTWFSLCFSRFYWHNSYIGKTFFEEVFCCWFRALVVASFFHWKLAVFIEVTVCKLERRTDSGRFSPCLSRLIEIIDPYFKEILFKELLTCYLRNFIVIRHKLFPIKISSLHWNCGARTWKENK